MSGTLKIGNGRTFLTCIQGRVRIFVRPVSWSSWRCAVVLFPLTMQAFGVLFDSMLRMVSRIIYILSIHDALLSRLSSDDDMEKNLSTFANEMTSSAMILGKYPSFARIWAHPGNRPCNAQNTCPDGRAGSWNFSLRGRWNCTRRCRRTHQDQGGCRVGIRLC